MNRRRTRDEFDRFVGESADALLRAAYLIVWDVTDAEDLVQECFLRLARAGGHGCGGWSTRGPTPAGCW